ncbi:PTS galactosamine transporter subunit IIB [Oceanotoga sp. DSM 15011]|jgi:PTS system N-acetylgalactosamine-specific IIB component|uniref:PTS system N-acetylgalactosamine-specific EIIB component (Man family) n=1 Tax=Oceanotoga teriensis TaxID=515440 RepID=A0AA45C6U8_9BACT|nr:MULTISPECIES: PTS galactosamine transporter subunit IIB [Oceanotoga]MDN5342246.1 N-acetylgalactosamine system component [Oceanotoga sp.]MDO7977273.1 PTS galactosamine transporter subunit IIB [Oceanotoga teriensis]PWJ93260.1 PTS system N-acetylgalactosamine-specific EIIB component (Man family) [Oceanotoga teriensis]UYP01257.1 PTS galactosamine transporter subunit IIB [Oceanotoga sp. DSM 15011]
MGEPNILLTRIDNRLIHGQVAVTWSNHLGTNLILVANDEVSKDQVQQSLMDMAAPENVQTRYFSIQKCIDIIHKAAPHQKIFIVVRTPEDVLKLVEGGVPLKKVNIGNMHFSEGKKQITSTVSVDENDLNVFKKLTDKNIECIIQRVPDEIGKDIKKFF